jgi:hypothetical protein
MAVGIVHGVFKGAVNQAGIHENLNGAVYFDIRFYRTKWF